MNNFAVQIGSYADYFDTGIWSRDDDEELVAPEDLTINQLRDFLLASGGAVYLKDDGKCGRFAWIPNRRG